MPQEPDQLVTIEEPIKAEESSVVPSQKNLLNEQVEPIFISSDEESSADTSKDSNPKSKQEGNNMKIVKKRKVVKAVRERKVEVEPIDEDDIKIQYFKQQLETIQHFFSSRGFDMNTSPSQVIDKQEPASPSKEQPSIT